ncbi:hypothetical protein FQA39_LY12471 [Lamprigera yunnana]|nr:hypothetical protein FQA39_LY12471 [Lamprigera yunnana]
MAKKLKGTNIWISEDYSKQVQKQRKLLLPYMKKARTKGNKANFDQNKLIINGERYTLEQIQLQMDEKSKNQIILNQSKYGRGMYKIVEEMIQQNIEIHTCNHRNKKELKKFKKKIHKERWIFWSGVDMKKRAKEGAGLIIASNRLKDVIQKEYGNERLLSVKMKLIDEEIWTIITVYGENEDARKKEKEQFYNELQQQINNGEDG